MTDPGSGVAIRDLMAADEAEWRRLWAAYIAFYEATVPDDVTAHTWRRLLDPAAPLIGRIAVCDGQAAGITVSVLHEGTWTMTPVCYLEDLFVDPVARGAGIGRALIQDLIDQAKAKGWSQLYWQTNGDNATARRLYDGFVPADGYVRYRIMLR
jgi:GNAT superfamily N-acetyltransferase